MTQRALLSARRPRGLRGAVIGIAIALAVPLVSAPRQAQAAPAARGTDAVMAWNLHAENAIFDVAGQTPTPAARSFATVQAAVYDAVNATAGAPYQPLVSAPRSRPGDSPDAAAATAAYRMLVWLFAGQASSLRDRYEESLAAIPDGSGKRGGIAVGEAAAAAMIKARTGDVPDFNVRWPVGDQPGQWRPTPPDFIPFGAWMADMRPFVVRDPGAYRVAAPPALTSAAWARDLNEVKHDGSLTSTTRTDDQTEAAKWWDDPRLVEYEIKRRLARDHRLGRLQTARMFAMVDVSAADALISCYKEKKRWSFWRPVTAIPLAATDGNPATSPDPNWAPLRTTAPSAEYPSGHACFTSATLAGLRKFFGTDRLTISAFSADSGTTRTYHDLSSAQAELNSARVWAGVHYRFASRNGDVLGVRASREVLTQAFQPRD